MTARTVTPSTTATRAVVVPAVLGLFAGSFLANAVPHSLAGLLGAEHPSPFGTSPVANLTWGAANLTLGIGLVLPRAARRTQLPFLGAAAAGVLGTAVSLYSLWS